MVCVTSLAVPALADTATYSPFSTTKPSITITSDLPGKLNVSIRGNTDTTAKLSTSNVIVTSQSSDLTNSSKLTLNWPSGAGYSTNGVYDEISGVGASYQTTVNVTPQVVFTFDDGWETAYTKAYQYMNQNGLKGTAYIVPTFLGKKNYMTSAQVQDMYNNGWCIANHTWDHPDMTNYTYDQAYTEMQEWITWAKGKGYTSGLQHLAFPHGAYNDNVLKACTDLGIVTARTVGHSLDSNFPLYGTPPQLLTPLTCGLGGDSPNSATVDAQIANAVAQNKVAILMFHEFVDTAGENGSSQKNGMNFVYSEFQKIVDYCKNTGVPVQTMDQFSKSLNTSVGTITNTQKALEFNTNYQCIQRCDKVVLDGTIKWTNPTLFENNTYRTYVTGWCSSHPDVSNAIGSNHTNFNDLQQFASIDAISGKLANHYQVAVHTDGNLYISLDKAYVEANGLKTAKALQTWLNLHPITMIYQKVTPVTTSIIPTVTTNGAADTSLRAWGNNTTITTSSSSNSAIPTLLETHRIQ